MCIRDSTTFQQKDGCEYFRNSPEKFTWKKEEYLTDHWSGYPAWDNWERELNRHTLHYFEWYSQKLNDGQSDRIDPKRTIASALENYQCKISNLEEIELIKTKLEVLEKPFRGIRDAEKERLRSIAQDKATKRKI